MSQTTSEIISGVPDNPETVGENAGEGCSLLLAKRRITRLKARAQVDTSIILPMNPNQNEHDNTGNPLLPIQNLLSAGDADGAASASLAILGSYEHAADALHTLALAYQRQGNLADALPLLKTAIRLQPDNDTACSNLGKLLNDLKRYDDADIMCRAALRINPKSFSAHTNLASALCLRNRYREGLDHFRLAKALNPHHPLAHRNVGLTLFALNQVEEARRAFETGLALFPDDPEIRFSYGHFLLGQGELRQGLPLYEGRWGRPTIRQPDPGTGAIRWLGECALEGKSILLRAEQGLGDTIQASRFIPAIAAAAQKVYVEVQRPLLALMHNSFGEIAEVVAQGSELPPTDLYCPFMSLPLAMGVDIESIPSPDHYLRVDAGRRDKWASELPARGRPRVGFVWKANPANRESGANRTIPIESFLALFRASAIEPICLQKDLDPAERIAIGTVTCLGPQFEDFADTAAAIEQLDLVVTVDTAVAHLAGALGKPVWIMIPAVSDWRWLRDRRDSPWYHSARLFRQSVFGNWDSVIAAVQGELTAMAGSQ